MRSLLHRRSTLVSAGLTAGVVWVVWGWAMHVGDRWHLFANGWFMSVTMAVGSFIAGATSEGGGAVAFPVMTLAFGIDPATARDFSLMIQTVGMVAASITILYTRIGIEHRALLWATVGGAVGVVVGLESLAGLVPPTFAKMLFVSTWLAFAFALWMVNRYRDREVHRDIQRFGRRQAAQLLATGVAGGMVSSITGSGLDILTFSLLVLLFRITESVATPTSVVLMGVNAAVGFAWKSLAGGGMAPEAWDYWWVCVPIVVVGAPLGAWFIKQHSRLVVAGFLYCSILVQFVAAILLIPMTPVLLGFSGAVLLVALLCFRWMANHGVRRLEWLAAHGTAGNGVSVG
jgi:uncharacterized membrane protein YfcA